MDQCNDGKYGSIIVKFYDRPSKDELFTKNVNLKRTTTADLGPSGYEKSMFINESLAFETKKKLL